MDKEKNRMEGIDKIRANRKGDAQSTSPKEE